MSTGQNSEPQVTPPLGVKIVSGIVLLEALMLIAVATWYLNSMFRSDSYRVGVAVFTLALIVLTIGWLCAVAARLYRGYRWTRSAALVWQLFLIVLSFPLFNAGQWAVALIMVIPAAAVLLLLFSGPVVTFMERRSGGGRTF